MAETTTDDQVRQAAIKRLKQKRDLLGHVVAYVIINVFLVLVWYFTSGRDSYFWPMWIMIAWGIGLVFNVWDVYGRKQITEAEIQREMDRQKGKVPPDDV